MVITVVDAQLGASTVNGRIVSHLTLDVVIRSTTEIELRQVEPGSGYHWINVAPPGTGFPLQPEEGLDLPAQIRAGSDETYRLEVPIDELRLEPADEFTTGTWTASLFLEGSGGAPGSPAHVRDQDLVRGSRCAVGRDKNAAPLRRRRRPHQGHVASTRGGR